MNTVSHDVIVIDEHPKFITANTDCTCTTVELQNWLIAKRVHVLTWKHTSKFHSHYSYWPSHVTPSPVKPARHAHSKLPMVLVHVALLGSQLSCPRAHSSMSIYGNKCCLSHHTQINGYWPSHVTPFPLNPGRHSQSKLPMVLIHVALLSQLSSSRQHSCLSVEVLWECCTFVYFTR